MVNIGMVIGGVTDLLTYGNITGGIESIAYGLKGASSALQHCANENPQLQDFLGRVDNFAHPSTLALKLAEQIRNKDIDLSVESTSAVLAVKGGNWKHLGTQIGIILQKSS